MRGPLDTAEGRADDHPAVSIDVVAREGELAVIDAFLDRPLTGPGALVIEGEPGIGKSTLWLAGVEEARARSIRVLSSRPAEAERTLPNVVLGDLFGEVPVEVLAKLPAPRRRAFEAALLLQEAPDVPVDPLALGVAILTLLVALSEVGPFVLAIDDDQFVDPSSAATLLFALRRLRREPIRLLVSRRSGGAPGSALEEAVDRVSVERLAVGPLSMGGVQVVLRQRLQVGFSRPTLTRIYETSGGNPLYALELARLQSAHPAGDGNLPLAVPPSLELLVDGRLHAIDEPTRQALVLVAAHGRFPLEFVGALGVPTAAMEQARAANLIETRDGVVRFTHPLLASALYQRSSDAARREAHRRLALMVDDPVHRGRHLALAADEPSDDLAAALETAASTASDRGVPVAAAELGEHAMRLTPPNAAADLHRRAIRTAQAYAAAGDGGHARSIAADLLAGAPPGRRRAEALMLRADLESPDVAVPLLDEAIAQAAGFPELEAVIHASLAEIAFVSSTRDRAWGEQHARASLQIAERLDDDALRANALSALAFLRFSDCDPDALDLAERAYRLAEKVGDRRQLQRAALSVAQVLTWSGKVDSARAWLGARLLDWSDQDERVRSDLLWSLVLVELWAGSWSDAGAHASQGLEISSQYGEHPYDRFPSALVALHRGEFPVAREHARHALSLGEKLPLEFFYGILATCDLWSGDPATALANFTLAEEAADSIGEDEPTIRYWRADHVEALLQLGRIDDAVRMTDDWESRAQALGRDRVLAQVVRCRGLIAAARGDIDAGLELLVRAVEAHHAAGDRFGHARALLAMGALRRRARQKRTARAAIEAAAAEFEALGATSWATTARRELARIGGRTRIVGLSPSEMRVASLVAEGRTNHEIAAALFLGERTIASHLTHIYAKLGIRSRTELARHVARQPVTTTGDASKVQTS